MCALDAGPASPDPKFALSPRLQALKEAVRDRSFRTYRQTVEVDVLREAEAEKLSWPRRAARLTRRMCEAERPVILPDERIAFTRTVVRVPSLYARGEFERLTAGRTLHELGPISNICADWGMVLSEGLLGRRRTAVATRERMRDDPEAAEFCECVVEALDAVLGLASRYAAAARAAGRADLAEVLERVPAHPARTFHEALQALRLCHAALWLSGHYHCGLGRLDQYLWPYLEADLATRRVDYAGAEELLAEFFIALNRDSDLYPGVQQGDNGQTVMLGGVKRDGSDAVNELTHMVLRVARGVALIDPKINLRVNGETDLGLLAEAAELTRLGLGFPQYSNDDVVIPALVAHGYSLEDARDYAVAACWEFVIPGRGMEVVNIGAVSMPAAADRAIREGLAAGEGFDHVVQRAGREICRQVDAHVEHYARLLLPPAPYHSALMDGCLERGRDLSRGLRYNNFGIHGACAAAGADALAAVQAFVFGDGRVTPARLLAALDSDFAHDEPLRKKLAEEAPKAGHGDERGDALMAKLFELFADACEAVTDNGRGGGLRPGSGSAMYYLWLARGHEGMREPAVGATADGRRAGVLFGANLAPTPGVAARGPFSLLRSFARVDYRRICNGGPVTMELAESVFGDAESVHKVALLIRAFARLGGQQLQLNTLSVEKLEDARRHPERHRDLIVRVWGWSGYFCELAPEYQEQILLRHVHASVS